MGSLLRLVQILAVVSALVTGAVALWRRRDRIKQTWGSLGGVEGIRDSASKLVESVGPVKDLVSQVAQLKR